MDFLKNHYEKVILGLVLLGVIIFAALLPGKISATQEELKEGIKMPSVGPAKPAKALDTAALDLALQLNAAPPPLKLSGEHNLFNPVRWRRLGPGLPPEPQTEGGSIDAQHFTVTAIRPLAFAIWFDSVRGSGTSMRYQFMILNEASLNPSGRRPSPRTLAPAVGQKNEIFTIMEIKGPVEDPAEVVIELAADKQLVTLGRAGRERGYQKIAGYEADGTYPPGKRNFTNLRVGMPVLLGEPWKVIAIDASSVTIADRIQKRETKQLASAANP
jgi:hypothetical protein